MKLAHVLLLSAIGVGCLVSVAVEFPTVPGLSITNQGTNVVVYWPDTVSPEFKLYRTSSCASTNWAPVLPLPDDINSCWTVQLPATNSPSFFRLVLGGYSGVDEPDDAFIDSNGDGIDGDISKAVFVATWGNDSAMLGTTHTPMATITGGLALAQTTGKTEVYVAAGTYNEGLVLVDGISIYGGYANTGDYHGWYSRADNNIVVVHTMAPHWVTANNLVRGVTLDRLTVAANNATAASGSSYGLLAFSSSGLVLHHCTIEAGNGAAGTAGASGAAGANGGNGQLGTPGCENGGLFCSTCGRPLGGVGGTSPCGRTGGTGGAAGLGSASGFPGSYSADGTAGGPGTPPLNANWNTPSTYWGANGNNGANGADGASGASAFTSSGYSPSPGGNGADGQQGNGGGGGGGGGGGTADCDSYGGGGGGGGGGASAGTHASGGQSGGGSIGVYVWASSVRLETCAVSSASGGNGGAGGTGGPGATGGLGAFNPGLPGAGNYYGGSGEQDDGSNGGRGGNGGSSGRGGHGGGGAGGATWAVVRAGSSVAQISGCTFAYGTPGAGGSSPGHPGPAGSAGNVY